MRTCAAARSHASASCRRSKLHRGSPPHAGRRRARCRQVHRQGRISNRAASSPAGGQQLHFKEQRGVGRDALAGAHRAVAQLRRHHLRSQGPPAPIGGVLPSGARTSGGNEDVVRCSRTKVLSRWKICQHAVRREPHLQVVDPDLFVSSPDPWRAERASGRACRRAHQDALAALLHGRDAFSAQDAEVPAHDDFADAHSERQRLPAVPGRVHLGARVAEPQLVVALHALAFDRRWPRTHHDVRDFEAQACGGEAWRRRRRRARGCPRRSFGRPQAHSHHWCTARCTRSECLRRPGAPGALQHLWIWWRRGGGAEINTRPGGKVRATAASRASQRASHLQRVGRASACAARCSRE